MQAPDLGAHLGAELGVEVAERLVEQEHFRVAHDGASHRDSLALASGEVCGTTVEIFRESENFGDFRDRTGDHILLHAPDAQAEGDVFGDVEMRVERIVLEHHRTVAILGRDAVHHSVVDGQGAFGDFLQPGDHSQRGGFPAAGGSDQHDEFVRGNLQVDSMNDLNGAEAFVDVLQDDC